MANWVDGRWNGVLTRVGFGAIVMMQAGCDLLLGFEVTDTRSGMVRDGTRMGTDGNESVLGLLFDGHGKLVLGGNTFGTGQFQGACGSNGNGNNQMFVGWLDPAKPQLDVPCDAINVYGAMMADAELSGVAVDRNGAIGLIGQSRGAIDFGKGEMVNNNGAQGVVVSIVEKSNCIWQWSFGDDGQARNGEAIDFDSTGAAIIGGRFEGTMTLASNQLTAIGVDGFVAKLAVGENKPKREKHIGGPGDQEVHALVVDALDNVVLGGKFTQQADFGCPLQSGLNTDDVAANQGFYVAALLGSDLKCLWQRKIADGPANSTTPLSLAVANDGAIFVAGAFQQMKFFQDSRPGDRGDCKVDPMAQSEDVFVAKLDTEGTCKWFRRFGEMKPTTQLAQKALAISVDQSSNVLVVGEFRDSIAFDSKGTFQSKGFEDAFMAKLNGADGAPIWSRVIQGSGAERARAIAMDPKNEFIMVAGEFDDSFSLGPDQVTLFGGSDIFVAKLSP